MTHEEAIKLVAAALAPQLLSTLQIQVFQRTWQEQSYEKMARELNHEYSYIKDVGAELWQLLSQKLGIQVTKLNLPEAVARYAQQTQKLPKSSASHRVDWGEAPDVSQFCGRAAQLATLEQWVVQDGCRLVAIVGMGGIGKTMLVTQLAEQLADTNQFEIVVWRSLRQAPPLVDLLSELLSVLAPSQPLPSRLDAMLLLLLEQLRSCRCLLVLDNVEAIFRSNQLVGTYQPGYEDYGWLLQQLAGGRHQSSVLLTTRELPAEVAIPKAVSAPVRVLRLECLSVEEAEIILAAKGLTFEAAQPQVRALIERYQGNPLALEIVATPLLELFAGNIAEFLAQETLLFKDIRSLLQQQFDRLSALETQVMYWLAINQEPVTAPQLQADLMPAVSVAQLQDALMSLVQRSLVETIKPNLTKLNAVSYTQQPMVMAYVTEQFIHQVCQFDPADQRLASSSDDCTVKLWELQTGRCLETLQGHTRPVVSINFHSQEKLLVSGSFDSSLKWDLEQGTYIITLQGHRSPIRSVAFDPEGRWIVSSSENGTIRLWDSCEGECFRVLNVERPCKGMNILGVTGLTDAQKETLRVLGAIES